jgi:ring-1,2-phenylacetyl-CoA epoxidase subunit PaaD
MVSDSAKEDITKKIWDILQQVPDPEIPVISVVELGVVRSVKCIDNEKVIIDITPTYSGCPAMKVFSDDIIHQLNLNGFNDVEINTVYSPAWTTDWITDEALEKLRKYGIAPPIKGTQDKGFLFESGPKMVPCPRCKSNETKLVSQFGSTACKALYSCEKCKEPFEYFKCI